MLKKVNAPQKESHNIFLEEAVRFINFDIFEKDMNTLADLIKQNSVMEKCTHLNRNQIALRKRYFSSVPNPRKCLELAKDYADEAGLYAVRFGEPFFNGTFMLPDRNKYVNILPSMIEIPFYITDGVHTLEENVYIEMMDYNGQDVNNKVHVDWTKVVWGARSSVANSRVLRAKFEKNKRGYVLVEVEDVEQAEALAKQLYENDETTGVHVWDRERTKSLNSHLVMSQMRAGRTKIPNSIATQIKPREERFNFLEQKINYSSDEIENEWFLEKNMKKLSESYDKFIVVQNSHVLSAGRTERAAVRKSELDPTLSYIVVEFKKDGAEYSMHRPKEE